MTLARVSRRAAFAASVLLTAAVASGQTRDVIQGVGAARNTNITIIPVYHGSLEILYRNFAIVVDPAAPANFAGLPRPGVILITDIHEDHLDASMVSRLSAAGTIVIAPAAAAGQLRGARVLANGASSESIFPGDSAVELGVPAIEAVPMYNLVRGPSPGELFHPKGRGNGYVVTLGGRRLYIAGDTECTPEMKALTNIDVAFIPMILPYTMPPSEAAECVKAFKPKIVYPYHYMGANMSEFTDALQGTGIEVRLREWYTTTAK